MLRAKRGRPALDVAGGALDQLEHHHDARVVGSAVLLDREVELVDGVSNVAFTSRGDAKPCLRLWVDG